MCSVIKKKKSYEYSWCYHYHEKDVTTFKTVSGVTTDTPSNMPISEMSSDESRQVGDQRQKNLALFLQHTKAQNLVQSKSSNIDQVCSGGLLI